MRVIFILLVGIFIFSGCKANKINENKSINKQNGVKKTKKYSKKPLKQTKFSVAMKELGKNQAVMFEVGSDSCHSCKQMALMLQEIKEDYPKFKVYFIDIGKERIASKELNVRLIPTQIFYDKKGNEIFRHVGKFKSKELLIKKLKSLGFKL